ncbi:MAG: UbiH/UbiF/VisC/COQ6 family ubiquinone biosynthesis hydroxylase [Rhodospirillaceae bacterium]|nr:UbiH/UbiF/VisC/COQ6 family ubiquinone biosynthesis hydroxylase [Rhodospirillaceae bacterium]
MSPAAAPPAADAAANVAAEVAVVGGGLVGGALGLGLARHGVKTVVIDKLHPTAGISPTFDGRASAIAAAGHKLLEGVGLWAHLAEKAEPILDIRVSDGSSLLFLHYDHRALGDGVTNEGPLGYMLENRHLRDAIARGLESAHGNLTVIAPDTVQGLSQSADAATLTLASGRTVTAKLVVAAEGRTSALRDAAGIALTGWDYPQTAIVATIGHERPHQGIAHERFLTAGPFAILPLKGGHQSSLVWTEAAHLAQHYLALNDADFIAAIDERVGGFLGQLTLVGPRFSYPLGVQFAHTYVKSRLALIGDAAHAIHPIAGQGLNLGLRDVGALIEAIVDAKRLGLEPAHASVLERYERWRRADNLLMAGVTDALNRLFSNDIAPIRIARDLGLGIVNRIPPLKKFFMRHAMGTVGDLPKLLRGEAL